MDEMRPLSGSGEDEPTEEDWAATAALLAELSFLRPDADVPTDEPMPDWAWARISTALAEQSAAPRHSRPLRWAGGLVAAAVAVVAVGVVVTAVRGSTAPPAVVADAGLTQASALMVTGAAPAPAAEAEADVLAAPQSMSYSGIAPARMIVDSDTDYTMSGLKDQVQDVMARFDVPVEAAATRATPGAPMMRMADVPATGFLATDEALRDCITKLTQEAESTALMVDHSTFEGQDAGVVVAPDASDLEVWVVDPDCDLRMRVWISRP